MLEQVAGAGERADRRARPRIGRRRARTATLAIVTALLAAADATAQDVRAAVVGTVSAADGRDAAGAAVALVDRRGLAVAETVADDRGQFRFEGVAPGAYAVIATSGQERSPAHDVVVDSARQHRLVLQLAPRLDESVVVRGAFDAPATTAIATLGRDALQQLPTRLGSRALPQMLATLPGWSSEDNGLLHVRGVDDGVLYVEDGMPVYDRIDATFGVAPSAAAIASMNVLTGYIPPEHGLKAGAVVEVHSAPRPHAWTAQGSTGGGSNRTATGQLTAGGPLTSSIGLGLGLVSERSDRFLDPVHPENYHNTGGTLAATLRVEATPGTRDRLLATVQGGGARFDVPHGAAQEDAGQDQRQRLRQQAQSASWQRAWSDRIVTQAAAYHRRIHGRLDDTPAATPLFAESRRTHDRGGVLASLTYERGRHAIKAGGEAARLALDESFRFAVTDGDAEDAELSERAVAFTLPDPFVFKGEVARWQGAFYVQDKVRVSDALTLDAGLRADRTRLLVPAAQWSPRLGAAYRWPGTATALRAAYNRFFQPPQPEHLLLASSPQARALSPFVDDDDDAGGAELQPERQHAWEVGVEHLAGGVARLSAAAWRRDVRNYADPNVFFGTTIIFPNSVAKGLARGLDVRADVPGYRGWSASVTYTLAKVEQTGPINGGLFLEDGIDDIGLGTTFTPDHDQRHAASAIVTYAPPGRRLTATASARYESGTPIEVGDLDQGDLEDLVERAGADLVDFARGRVKPRLVVDVGVTARVLRTARGEIAVAANALNLFDRAYAFNFGNPFSGTHFGAPRQFRIDLRFAFE